MESKGHSCIIQNIDFIPQTKKLRVWVAELSSKTQSWWTVAVRSRVPLYSLQTPGLAFSCCSLAPGGSEAIIFRSWLELSELWDNVKDGHLATDLPQIPAASSALWLWWSSTGGMYLHSDPGSMPPARYRVGSRLRSCHMLLRCP